VVREHFDSFLDHARQHYEKPLPHYVKRELSRYLDCLSRNTDQHACHSSISAGGRVRRALFALHPSSVLHHPCSQPLLDESQDPFVPYPMLKELHHPSVIDGVVIRTDVGIEHPIHLLAHDSDRQCIERIVLTALRAADRSIAAASIARERVVPIGATGT
jgi:hypothetical protein